LLVMLNSMSLKQKKRVIEVISTFLPFPLSDKNPIKIQIKIVESNKIEETMRVSET
jgi:hypothetical protein